MEDSVREIGSLQGISLSSADERHLSGFCPVKPDRPVHGQIFLIDQSLFIQLVHVGQIKLHLLGGTVEDHLSCAVVVEVQVGQRAEGSEQHGAPVGFIV